MFAPSFPIRPVSRGLRRRVVALLLLVPMALGLWMGYRVSEKSGLSQLAVVANERLELYASALASELARDAFLPSLVAAEPDVQAVLNEAPDAALRAAASRTLARIGVRAGASLVVVTSADQRLLASSDSARQPADAPRDLQRQFPGIAYALADGAAEFFAANESDGSTDYYFVHSVRRAGRVIGHVIVKVSLAPLEATWVDLGLRSQSERLLVVDENDVVVMSSIPGWKYRRIGRAMPHGHSGRYAAASLAPLELALQQTVEPGVTMVKTPPVDGGPARLFMAQERALVPQAARLIALSDPSLVRRDARNAAWGGAAGGTLVGLLLLYLLHRRRVLQEFFLGRKALQGAHDELERQVDARTRELQRTNEELKREIAQRRQAEDEVVQAGKLAALGQMSAGISHEINQPLTALRALSSNAMRLLDAGRTADVAGNLRHIDEMAERMGRVVNQLKSYARRDGLSLHPVALLGAVHNVLLMLDHRLQTEPVQLLIEIPEHLEVRADRNRLEQVLLNLVGNALDAMIGTAQRRLVLTAVPRGERVLVRVDDSGPGMDEAQMARLFEPFFTTKPVGQGLGLGLMISSKIVGEFGGHLRAERLAAGMRFEFDLEAIGDADV
ncbi:MAG: sensor histidine kinase [Burkholderiales bacterium]|nr:sensor histidine kinase [Burkholderiales bacterium]